MSDLVILGTDTGMGKTTFAALWMTAFKESYEYWKPVETGPSDTEIVRRLVPGAVIHAPAVGLSQAVAPPLAARLEDREIPSATALAAARPVPTRPGCSLLVETFGSPLSPLNQTELQVSLIAALASPMLLICSSAVGAIGRTLQCLQALEAYKLRPLAVVLIGPCDAYAVLAIQQHRPGVSVFGLKPPQSRDADAFRLAAETQLPVLKPIRSGVSSSRSVIAAGAPIVLDGSSQLNAQGAGQLIQRDRSLIWHPYTALRDLDPPLVCTGAHDEFLELAGGQKVIDAISSWWTILHGHRHPVLMSALAEASRFVDHVLFAGVTHPWAVELAELLLATAPWPGGRVFFSDNGSTAVEVALKMAYQFWCHQGEPGRTLFVGFEHGYHGDTFGAMAAGRDPVFFGRFEPLLFRSEIIPICPDRLDSVLKKHPGQVAAVIIEPLVQGAGGMHMHSPAELRALADAARRHNVLFIADEVMTGGGRLGPLWAHQEAGIAADLICTAKTLAGGVLPLAATLVAPRIVAAFDTAERSKTFFHGHSFTAHPLACALGVANWKLLTQGPLTAASRMEAFWKEALAPLARHRRIRDLRIRGTIAALEVDAAGGYLADVGRQLRLRCLEAGVFLRPLGNVLYAMPPLCTSDDSLDRIATAMVAAVQSLA
jgi:adenosylmethionine-8-amino-7-oxononanoate aminotransferase